MIDELKQFSEKAKSLAAAMELSEQVKKSGSGAVRISFSATDGQGAGKMFKLSDSIKFGVIQKLEELLRKEISDFAEDAKHSISSIGGADNDK